MKEQESLIRLRSFKHELIQETLDKIKVLSETLKISLGGSIPLPTKKKIFTILRSPHINKQSREQFEIRTHTKVLKIKTLEKDKVLNFIGKIKDICPTGVSIKIDLGFITKESKL